MAVRDLTDIKPEPNLDYLPTVSRPKSAAAGAIRELRSHVLTQHVQAGHRALAVCSTSAGSGCTFVAVNLAVALSQMGANTLLIDGDLYNPTVGAFFRQKEIRPGLRECITTPNTSFSDYIEGEVIPKLSILFSGNTAHNPPDLLASSRFSDLMDFCLREFDSTVIDTPPANTSSDANRICNVASYCVIVARRNGTLIREMKTLIGQLKADRAQIIGTVLNRTSA